jgi:hypothetical protein
MEWAGELGFLINDPAYFVGIAGVLAYGGIVAAS